MADGNCKLFWSQSLAVVIGYLITEIFLIKQYSLVDFGVSISAIEITLLFLNFFNKIKAAYLHHKKIYLFKIGLCRRGIKN
jgi:hypothetical protein